MKKEFESLKKELLSAKKVEGIDNYIMKKREKIEGLLSALESKINEVEKRMECAPTYLCKTPQTHEFVKDIIAKLKVIDVDGETMQYIIEQVGMSDQIFKQLMVKISTKEINLFD